MKKQKIELLFALIFEMPREQFEVNFHFITIILELYKNLQKCDLVIYQISSGKNKQILQINLWGHEFYPFELILLLNTNIY